MKYEVIDFHLHLPWRYSDPKEAAKKLLHAMDLSNVKAGVVIAIELSLKRFQDYVNPEKVRRAVSDALDYLIYSRLPQLEKIILNAAEGQAGIEEIKSIIVRHLRPNSHVAQAASVANGRLLPVASYNPDLHPREFVAYLEENSFIGVKLYPTLHFCRPSTKRLDFIYNYMEETGLILIVHTGCDPGIWELPGFCQYARPRELAYVAKRHPGLKIVMAHLGAYSALSPGIFFDEALEVMSRYDNVYADTSAVDPFYVELAIDKVGYDKLLFGSDYPYVAGLTISDYINSIVELGLEDKVLRKIFYDNATRLLNELATLRAYAG